MEVSSTPSPVNPYQCSILKPSTNPTPWCSKTLKKDPYQLQHQKLVKILMLLTSDNAVMECHRTIVHLFMQFLDVDADVAILPAQLSLMMILICTAGQLPSNWTKLGRFVHLKGSAYSLHPCTNQNGDRKLADIHNGHLSWKCH